MQRVAHGHPCPPRPSRSLARPPQPTMWPGPGSLGTGSHVLTLCLTVVPCGLDPGVWQQQAL